LIIINKIKVMILMYLIN